MSACEASQKAIHERGCGGDGRDALTTWSAVRNANETMELVHLLLGALESVETLERRGVEQRWGTPGDWHAGMLAWG